MFDLTYYTKKSRMCRIKYEMTKMKYDYDNTSQRPATCYTRGHRHCLSTQIREILYHTSWPFAHMLTFPPQRFRGGVFAMIRARACDLQPFGIPKGNFLSLHQRTLHGRPDFKKQSCSRILECHFPTKPILSALHL